MKIDYERLDTEWTAAFAKDLNEYLLAFLDHLPHITDLPVKNGASLTEILRGFVGDKYTCRDFDVWHKYITKPMFDGGWAMLYLPIIMQIATYTKVPELRMETLKWVLVNWNWITATYGTDSFDAYVSLYNDLGNLVRSEFPEEQPLREKLNILYKKELENEQRNEVGDNHEIQGRG